MIYTDESVTIDEQGLTESDNVKDPECHENLETVDIDSTTEEEKIESENLEENNENHSDEK